MISGTFLSKKPFEFTGIDEIQKQCDFISCGIVNGVREPILFSCVLDKPPRRKTYKEHRNKPFNKCKDIGWISYHFSSRRRCSETYRF